MNRFTQTIYQVIFHTKWNKSSLEKEYLTGLFSYLAKTLNANNCNCYAVGGTEDHIHLLFELHPAQSLSELVKTIKLAASDYIKRTREHPGFSGWQGGYGAFTYAVREKEKLIEYVLAQDELHKSTTVQEEFKALLAEHQIEFDPGYLH